MSDKLRNLREKVGLTQTQLAGKISISRVNYNRYENGERFPDQGTLIQLAEFFDVSIDYLLGRDIQPAPIKIEPSPPQFSDDELALIEKYRKMKDNEKDTMHKVADTIAPNDDEQAAAVGK